MRNETRSITGTVHSNERSGNFRTRFATRGTLRTAGSIAVMLAVWAASGAAQAQSYTVLHVFNVAPDAANPNGGLIQAADGNFYGITQFGGVNNMGNVYRMNAAGAVTVLRPFDGPTGFDPFGELVQGTDGNFYGTAALGGPGIFNGNGVVYRITPAGVYTVLHFFNGTDGSHPGAGLVQGPDGNFYGTTGDGGPTDNGTVFRVSPGGAFTVLHNFTGPDGQFPDAALIVGADGNLYGVTGGGGSANGGTVFRITPAGVFTSLHSFTFAAGDGNDPRGALVLASDGNFYGTTEFGGTNDNGTTFRMTPSGATTILHSFSGPEGQNPLAGLIQASNGLFYGTCSFGGTATNGTLFSMTAAGAVAVLHSFDTPTGSNPTAKVLQGSDGALYGVTSSGGRADFLGQGVAFKQVIAAGPATATPKVQVNTAFFTEDDVLLTTPVGITALNLTITATITPGLQFSGMFQNIFGQITQTHSTGPTTITYNWVLQAGSTIPPGTWTFAAQMSSNGVVHNTHLDSFTLTYTAGGQTFTQTGGF